MKSKVRIINKNACVICGGTPATRTLLIDMTSNKKICCCCASRIKGFNAFDCCEYNNLDYNLE